MSGVGRTSLPAVEEAEAHVDALRRHFLADGELCATEQRLLSSATRTAFYAARTDDAMRFISLLTRGESVDSPWFARRRRETVTDRLRLLRGGNKQDAA